MNKEISILREKVKAYKAQFQAAEAELASRINRCEHIWGEVRYDPIREEAYTIPGDPPGIGGSDHQFECHIPSKTTPRWVRQCEKCGKMEITTRFTETTVKTPRF